MEFNSMAFSQTFREEREKAQKIGFAAKRIGYRKACSPQTDNRYAPIINARIMDTGIITEIATQIMGYVKSLDWAYILTFIIIGYGINSEKFTNQIKQKTNISSKRRYRTALVGLVYAVILYFIRGYEVKHIEVLFQSFVFAFVFHKLILDGLVRYITSKRTDYKTLKENENAT